MRARRWAERLLFVLFFAIAGAMLATGIVTEQVPETLFNATLV